MRQKIRIALLSGGTSSEREVSLKTGLMIKNNLSKDKFITKLIDTGSKHWQKYIVNNRNSFDLAFIALHGKGGEDGIVQGFLETINLPYTGSGVLTSAIGMSKTFSQLVFKALKIATPFGLKIYKADFDHQSSEIITRIIQIIGLPCIIKPDTGGSSLGIFLVKEEGEIRKRIMEAFNFDDTLLVEKYLKGKEITAGIIGNFDSPENLISLPLIEIVPNKKHDFFDYEAKYQKGASDEIVPARINKKLAKKIQKMTISAYTAFSCRGFARFDVILMGNKPYFLEINTIPGMTENSLLPKAAKAYGFSFPQMLEMIINLAIQK